MALPLEQLSTNPKHQVAIATRNCFLVPGLLSAVCIRLPLADCALAKRLATVRLSVSRRAHLISKEEKLLCKIFQVETLHWCIGSTFYMFSFFDPVVTVLLFKWTLHQNIMYG